VTQASDGNGNGAGHATAAVEAKTSRRRRKKAADHEHEGPMLCSRCACPRCSSQVFIDGRQMNKDALDRIEREWLDRGLIV